MTSAVEIGTEVEAIITNLYLDQILELAAIFISGLAGGIAGIRKGFDMFGVVVLAWVASLFGGVLRDVMIGSIPPVGISNWRFLVAAVAGGVAIFFLYPLVSRRRKSLVVLDAFAMALFVWIGTIKGLEFDMGYLASAIVGVLTGIGGGVVRDMFTNNMPLVLTDRQYYAIPACLGAVATVVCFQFGFVGPLAAFAVVAGIVAFRLLALKFHWEVPAAQPRGLTD